MYTLKHIMQHTHEHMCISTRKYTGTCMHELTHLWIHSTHTHEHACTWTHMHITQMYTHSCIHTWADQRIQTHLNWAWGREGLHSKRADPGSVSWKELGGEQELDSQGWTGQSWSRPCCPHPWHGNHGVSITADAQQTPRVIRNPCSGTLCSAWSSTPWQSQAP